MAAMQAGAPTGSPLPAGKDCRERWPICWSKVGIRRGGLATALGSTGDEPDGARRTGDPNCAGRAREKLCKVAGPVLGTSNENVQGPGCTGVRGAVVGESGNAVLTKKEATGSGCTGVPHTI